MNTNTTTTITCPVCNTPIVIEPNALLQGMSFQCSNCSVAIALSNESLPEASKAICKFNELKNKTT